MKKILLASLFGLLTLSACNFSQPKTTPATQNANLNVATGTQISIVLPTQDRLKFCNGADMDSDGFRQTITQKETVTIPETNLTLEQLANKTIVLASAKAGLSDITAIDQNIIKINGTTAYLKPIDGWAGVSIFLCAWQPFVEVNLLQLPGIQKVVWVNDLPTWQNLTK